MNLTARNHSASELARSPIDFRGLRAFTLIGLLAVAAIWLSLRFALPHADRASLGKTARKLRLV